MIHRTTFLFCYRQPWLYWLISITGEFQPQAICSASGSSFATGPDATAPKPSTPVWTCSHSLHVKAKSVLRCSRWVWVGLLKVYSLRHSDRETNELHWDVSRGEFLFIFDCVKLPFVINATMSSWCSKCSILISIKVAEPRHIQVISTLPPPLLEPLDLNPLWVWQKCGYLTWIGHILWTQKIICCVEISLLQPSPPSRPPPTMHQPKAQPLNMPKQGFQLPPVNTPIGWILIKFKLLNFTFVEVSYPRFLCSPIWNRLSNWKSLWPNVPRGIEPANSPILLVSFYLQDWKQYTEHYFTFIGLIYFHSSLLSESSPNFLPSSNSGMWKGAMIGL